MRLPLFLLCFLAFSYLSAQKMSVVERETANGYVFSVSSDRLDRVTLNAAFAEVAETEVHPGFRGDWSTSDATGIRYSMDTREAFITIRYRGSNSTTIERAKAQAATVRQLLDLPAAPRGAGSVGVHPH